jgi:nucleolar protein 16
MGREIQKKKNRSGIAKTTMKPKSKKLLLANPLIAANWDKSQTLAQNYSRLGLARKLNGHTGGVDKTSSLHASNVGKTTAGIDSQGDRDMLDVHSKRGPRVTQIIPTEARIERDSEGRIVRIIDDPSAVVPEKKEKTWATPLNDPLNAVDDEEEYDSDNPFGAEEDGESGRPMQDRKGHMQHLSAHVGTSLETNAPQQSVVQQLSAQAAMGGGKKIRKQSPREREWCAALIKKHGMGNWKPMQRDTKLNVMQQSEGDIRKRVETYASGPRGPDGAL